MVHRIAWVSLIAGLFLGRAQARAEDIAPGIYELGEIVVSAPRYEPEAAGTVLTLTSEEIWHSGARTVDEAIDLLPGVYVRMGGSGTPRIDIRGFRTRHVMLLLDGIPLNDTYDGQFDPTTIPVENIAKIKLTTGGGSVLYGPGGNGGIINIITRKGTGPIHGTFNAEAGQGGAYLGKFTFSGASDRWNVFVSGSPARRDGFRLPGDFKATPDEDGGLRNNSDQKRDNLFANIGFAPSSRALLGLTLNYLRGENGVPSVVNYDKNDPFSKKPKYDRIDNLKGYSAQLASRYELSRPLSLKSWIYLNRLQMDENLYDDATYGTQNKSGASHTASTAHVAGANVQMRYDGSTRGAATLGLSVEGDSRTATGVAVDKKNNTVPFDQDNAFQVYSAALQYELAPLPTVGLVSGLSYHYQRKSGGGESDVSYLIGGHDTLRPGTQARVSFARQVRFPSIQQLYDLTSGAPDLHAERTRHFEAGITQTVAKTATVSATGFLTDADGFIEKDTDGFYRNFQSYRFQGIEIALESKPDKALGIRASYAYLHSEDRSPGGDATALQYRPKHKTAVEGDYAFAFGLTAHASLLYVAGQYLYDNATPPQQKALGNYTLAGFKVSQSLLQRRVEVYAGADNLFDQTYEQSYGLPQPGRQLYAGVLLRP